jgi:hypothetical protein
MQFVDNIFTDGINPSEYWSSVISRSVSDAVRNKKKPTTDGLTDGEARQKKISLENFIDGILPFVFSTIITDGKSEEEGKEEGEIEEESIVGRVGM